MSWTTEGSKFKSRYGKEFSILRVIQTGSGGHPVSYPMSTADSIPGVKRQGREADRSHPYSDEVKKTWFYTSSPFSSSWRSA
jgi:hypothetical protein